MWVALLDIFKTPYEISLYSRNLPKFKNLCKVTRLGVVKPLFGPSLSNPKSSSSSTAPLIVKSKLKKRSFMPFASQPRRDCISDLLLAFSMLEQRSKFRGNLVGLTLSWAICCQEAAVSTRHSVCLRE